MINGLSHPDACVMGFCDTHKHINRVNNNIVKTHTIIVIVTGKRDRVIPLLFLLCRLDRIGC